MMDATQDMGADGVNADDLDQVSAGVAPGLTADGDCGSVCDHDRQAVKSTARKTRPGRADIPPELIPKDGAWKNKGKCRSLLFTDSGRVDPSAIEQFFVAAGHVISPEMKSMCRTCPVRRECLVYSFTCYDGDMAVAGYYAGFSHGQRRSTSFSDLLAVVDQESDVYRTDA